MAECRRPKRRMDHGSFAVFCIVCFSVVGLSSSSIPVGLGPTVLFVSISQVKTISNDLDCVSGGAVKPSQLQRLAVLVELLSVF